MTPKQARSIISKISIMPYEERIKKLSTRDWDFIIGMNHILTKYPAWEKITEYQAGRFVVKDARTSTARERRILSYRIWLTDTVRKR